MFLKAEIPYFGVAFTEVHAELGKVRLYQQLFKDMCEDMDALNKMLKESTDLSTPETIRWNRAVMIYEAFDVLY